MIIRRLGSAPVAPVAPAGQRDAGMGTATGVQTSEWQALKRRVLTYIIAAMPADGQYSTPEQMQRQAEALFDEALERETVLVPRSVRQRLLEQVIADIVGFGPLDQFLHDDTITEIMVNGPNSVYIERRGRIEKTDVQFDSNEHVIRIMHRILAPIGRHIDEFSPMVDARLPDGARVNAVIPPISLVGPTINVRRFPKKRLSAQDLISFGTIPAPIMQFLDSAVKARLNIVISGGTGSGKTTLLNVLSGFIPATERIVTIEDIAELQLQQDHVVTLEARKPNMEGRGEVGLRDLVINALRMRPDRIVVGEVRGKEALDMLQAMNTGHDGSLTTAHSNSPRDTLSRIETMVMMAGFPLPVKAIREQISRAINLVVHEERMRDGSRRVVSLTEIVGMEGDLIVMQEIFSFVQEGIREGKIVGELRPTGVRPRCYEQIIQAGLTLPQDLFGKLNLSFK
jgi:pilus assembly protein CpaF